MKARAWIAALLVLPMAASARAEIEWGEVRDEAAELLSEYIQLDTSNPPGNEILGAEYLEDFFDDIDVDAEIYEPEPGRGSVVARLPATDPDGRGAILLLSHIDVVPANPSAWSFAPFSGAIENEHVFGRGALDDKGQGIVHAKALELLARSGLPRARDIVFCASAAEETQGENVGIEWLVENHWKELGPPVAVWNEGGGSSSFTALGGVVVNAVAVTEKRALWITLTAEGEGGHGSTPVDGSANDRLVAAAERIRRHSTPMRATPTVAEGFQRMAEAADFPTSWVLRNLENPLVMRLASGFFEENRLMRAMLRDTIAHTGLRSGLKHNVIPRTASATYDVRLLPDSDAAAFLARFRSVIDDPTIRLELQQDELPPEKQASPWDNELFRAIEAEVAVEFEESVTIPLQTTGGSDSKWFREMGIPAYGYIPIFLDQEYIASIHGLNERIPLRELERAVRVTYRTLVRLVAPN